jgi:asparagine synthase (glutamine-hydrolysing)
LNKTDNRTFSVLRPEYARRRHIESPPDYAPPRSQKESRERRWKIIQNTTASGAAIATGYRAEYGVELRDPTGDIRIAEFCLSLPVEQFCKDGVSRRLARRAINGRLPDDIVTSRKRGLQAADWSLDIVESYLAMRAEIDKIETSALARELIDIDGLRNNLDRLFEANSRGEQMPEGYRNYFEDGFMVGSFIRWFEADR